MVSYRLLQRFDEHGRSVGHSIEVLVSSDDISESGYDSLLDHFEEDLDTLECLRSKILCINSNTSETYLRLLQDIDDARQELNRVRMDGL